MSSTGLQQPVLEGGIRSINFFNGRLLSAEDLSTEAAAHEEARRRLGLAIGEGVASGLEVSPTQGVDTTKDPRVTITQGLAINRRGNTLALSADVDVSLVRPQNGNGSTPVSAAFSDCPSLQLGTLQSGTYVAGAGVYLLTIGPAAGSEGKAPVSGLGNVTASCNTRYTVEGVQFRLIALDLSQQIVNDRAHLRNTLAHMCFGTSDLLVQLFSSVPFSNLLSDGYGLIDALRPNHLTDCEVPLAVLYWTVDNGIEFVDMWSVRRRLVRPAADQRWPLLISDRRVSEAEAMFLQFDDQIEGIVASEANLIGGLAATQRFSFLPPVGMLPVQGDGSPNGFDPVAFFGSLASRIAMTDGNLLRSLLHEALYHEPIDLSAPDKIQLYHIFENVRAVQAGSTNQLILVFASRTLPYRGVARFGYAHWDLSRFASAVI